MVGLRDLNDLLMPAINFASAATFLLSYCKMTCLVAEWFFQLLEACADEGGPGLGHPCVEAWWETKYTPRTVYKWSPMALQSVLRRWQNTLLVSSCCRQCVPVCLPSADRSFADCSARLRMSNRTCTSHD